MSSSLMELLSSCINQAKGSLEETARLLGVEPSVARQLCLKVYKCTPQQYYLSRGDVTWNHLLGERLKGVRESLCLSITETARLYGYNADDVNTETVRQWMRRTETGQVLPSLAQIYRFVQSTRSVTGIGMAELFAGLPIPEGGKKGRRGRQKKRGEEVYGAP